MNTLVHWYMGWYGCCLKGINPWVVVVLLLIALAVMVAFCVCSVRLVRPLLKAWMLKRKARDSKEDTSEVQLRLLDPWEVEAEDEV